MGGVGKTELALQYAGEQWKQGRYPGGVCWLQARGVDLRIQIVAFARAHLPLRIPEDLELSLQVAYCWRNWLPGEVLIVLDDVTDYKQVREYLPSDAPRFKVLITTRWQLGASIEHLSLDVLKPRAALVLLESLVDRERLKKEPWVARKLCRWLGYLPLGLELVGRYLRRKPDLSLAEILSRLQAKRLEQLALKKPKSENDMTAQLGVQDAFELSWQELDESAQQLGLCLSLFALAPIPWQLVERCLPDSDPEELEEIRDYSLVNLHLVGRKGDNTYQLHQLIREFFCAKLKQSAEADDLKRGFCQVMVAVAKEIPYEPSCELIAALAPAIPHLVEVADHLTTYLSDENCAVPFSRLGRFYEGQGFYVQAECWYKQCLEASKKRLGDEHQTVTTSLNDLAYIYKSQGRYLEAEPLYIKALALRKRLLGGEHTNVAQSLNNLAGLYRKQGRYSEAEPFLLEALALRKRLLGEEHTNVGQSLNHLAYLYYEQGRYSEAESFYLQALSLYKDLLKENHPHTATSLNNLALLYEAQGRYLEAEPLYLQALKLRQRLIGKEHPRSVISLTNLAKLYHTQGRYTEAEPLYVEALEIVEEKLGAHHPTTVTIRENLQKLRDKHAA